MADDDVTVRTVKFAGLEITVSVWSSFGFDIPSIEIVRPGSDIKLSFSMTPPNLIAIARDGSWVWTQWGDAVHAATTEARPSPPSRPARDAVVLVHELLPGYEQPQHRFEFA